MKAKLILTCMLFGMLPVVFADDVRSESLKVKFVYQYSGNYPFQTGEGTIDWKKPGIAVELLLLLGKKLDIDIEFSRVPWKRGLHELKKGQKDGLFNASFKKKRLEYGVYPMKDGVADQNRKSYSNSYVLYKIKGSPVQWNGKAFSNLNGPIVATRGFSILDDLIKMGIKVRETNSTLVSLRILSRGRVKGIAALELAGDYLLDKNKEDFSNIEKVLPPIKTKPYYLMLSHQFIKKNPKIAEEIWNTVRDVRESEEFKQVTGKYFQ
ncbi:MAG: transporter substrate-binding domain-containing protein [Desulfobacterales bacterium]|nr:transporter substrate-binding domain-containing protein [Desulfobacterales bacterium]